MNDPQHAAVQQYFDSIFNRVTALERQMGMVQHRLDVIEGPHGHGDIARQIAESLQRLTDTVERKLSEVVTTLKLLDPMRPVGIGGTHGPANLTPPTEFQTMAKKSFKVSFAPKGTAMRAQAPAAKATAADPVVDFSLQEGTGDTVSVQGVSAGGTPLDISAVATLAVTSSDTSVLTCDPPSGMTFKEKALKAGTGTVTVVATWNDGSVGPFSFSYPVTVAPGGPAGLLITHGTPVAN